MASVGDPFVLSSYPSNVFASFHAPPRSNQSTKAKAKASNDDGYVSLAAQADGIHILDLAALHDVASHSLGPATTFVSAPVTSPESSTTYAPVASSPDIPPNEAGRTVWAWTEDLSSSISERAASNKKRRIVLEHPVSSLWTSRVLQRRVGVVGTKGELTLFSDDGGDDAMLVMGTRTADEQTEKVLDVYVFESAECQFISNDAGKQNEAVVVVLLLAGKNSTTRMQVLSAQTSDEISVLAEAEVPLKIDEISCTSLNASGCFSALNSKGIWHPFEISLSSSTLELTLLNPPPPTLSNTSLTPSLSSLLALTSTHTLLASPTPSTHPKELSLHIWDLRFGILLAEGSVPIPSAMRETAEGAGVELKVKLVGGGEGQAVLVLSTVPKPSPAPVPSVVGKKGKGKIQRPAMTTTTTTTTSNALNRSTVIIVPYTVPSLSTIANALGRAAAGKRWLATAEGTERNEKYSKKKADLLKKIREAMDGDDTTAAGKMFFDWVERETKELEEAAKEKAKEKEKEKTAAKAKTKAKTTTEEEISKSDEKNAEETVEEDEEEEDEDEDATLPDLGHAFTQDLLAVILHPVGKTPNTPHPIEVVRYLLKQKAVASGMVEGGLLSALRAKGDWKSIELAIQNVLDLTEAEVILTLRFIIAHHLHTQKQRGGNVDVDGDAEADADANAMDVDPIPETTPTSLSTLPTLPHFLSLITQHIPLTPPQLRRYIRTPEETTALLQILDRWVGTWNDRQIKLMPTGKELRKNKEGIVVPVLGAGEGAGAEGGKGKEKQGAKKDAELPPLDKITILIQALLDSSFILLLSHPPAHKLLKQLHTHIQPQLAFLDMLTSPRLRGFLEPFDAALGKAVREAKAGKEPVKAGEGAKKQRKIAMQQQGMGVGLYQLEELTI